MKISRLTNKKIGEFDNINITGQPVSGVLIQKTKFGELISRIKKIFNTHTPPENSIFTYRDNDTKQIIHRKIIITDRLSKNTQYNNYYVAYARLSEVIFAAEESSRDVFLTKITRINFSKSFIKNNDIFNLGMIAEKYHGYYNVVFSQKEFIADYELPETKVIYGKQGICHALALKWLAAQGTNLEKEIFTDLIKKNADEIPEGREEIFCFSMKYHSSGRFYANMNTDASYPKKMTFASDKNEVLRAIKNMTPEEKKGFRESVLRFTNELSINTDKVALDYMQMYSTNLLTVKKLKVEELLPEHSGKYEIIFSSLKKEGHHGIAIYIDESKSVARVFDPNHGVFFFNTVTDMNAAVIKLVNHGKLPGSGYKIEYGYQFLQQG